MPHDVYLLQGNDDIAYDGLLSASIEQPAEAQPVRAAMRRFFENLGNP